MFPNIKYTSGYTALSLPRTNMIFFPMEHYFTFHTTSLRFHPPCFHYYLLEKLSQLVSLEELLHPCQKTEMPVMSYIEKHDKRLKSRNLNSSLQASYLNKSISTQMTHSMPSLYMTLNKYTPTDLQCMTVLCGIEQIHHKCFTKIEQTLGRDVLLFHTEGIKLQYTGYMCTVIKIGHHSFDLPNLLRKD